MSTKSVLNPKNNAPEAKGVRTVIQSVGGVAVSTVLLFLSGLWNVPGVADYIGNFVQTHAVELFLTLAPTVGIPAGLIAYFQNKRAQKY